MITSEQAIYRKVPPAKQLKTISIIGLLEFCKIIPIITPIGVNNENINKSEKMKLFLFGNTFAIEIPKDMPAAPLCIMIAKHKSYTWFISLEMPTAIPSNIACAPSPIINIKGVILSKQVYYTSFDYG
jgi:hypothetical protein